MNGPDMGRRPEARIPEAPINPDNTTRVLEGHEASAWMRSTVAARLAEFDRFAAFVNPATLVLLPLGTVPATPGSREDRTCDRCRVCVQPDGLFVLLARPNVAVFGGLCPDCADREGVRP